MTINSFVSKSIALILSFSLFAPMIAFAQAAPEQVATPVPVETAAPVAEETSAPEPVPAADVPLSDPVQDTAPTQEAVTGDVLEGTSNPEEATSTDSQIIPIVEASSTEPAVEDIPVVNEVVPEPQSDIPMPPAEELTVVAETLAPVVETVSEHILPLKDSNDSLDPDYVIALSGKVIPAVKQGVLGKAPVSAGANVSIDSTDGSIKVSGACANVYFVVLLFRNQTDYAADPASYIVNRAYPCVGGAYSYDINDLPTTIQNGTYYLLIGEQGDKGSWSPITALTEVSINRSN